MRWPAAEAIAEAQAAGDIVAWLDLAHALDPVEAVGRGVDLRWLLVIRPTDAMEGLGVNFSGRLSNRVVRQVPGRALVEVNKRIGLQLLARAGGRGVAQFPKAIPVVGGVVGGAFDAVVCRMVGRTAKILFRPVADG